MINPLAKFKRLNRRGRIAVGLIALVILFFGVYGAVRLNDWRKSRNTNKAVETIQTETIDPALKQAEEHGDNANNSAARRQVLDNEVDESRKRREKAKQESDQSAANVREAQKRYEETLHTDPANRPPVLSDDELCAKLRKLYPDDQSLCR